MRSPWEASASWRSRSGRLPSSSARSAAYGATQAAKYQARLLALLASALTTRDWRRTCDPVLAISRRHRRPSTLNRPDDSWGPALAPAASRAHSRLQAALVVHCSLASGVVPSAAWQTRSASSSADRCSMRHAPRDARRHDRRGSATQTSASIAVRAAAPTSAGTLRIVDSNVVLVRGAIWAAAAVDAPWVDDDAARRSASISARRADRATRRATSGSRTRARPRSGTLDDRGGVRGPGPDEGQGRRTGTSASRSPRRSRPPRRGAASSPSELARALDPDRWASTTTGRREDVDRRRGRGRSRSTPTATRRSPGARPDGPGTSDAAEAARRRARRRRPTRQGRGEGAQARRSALERGRIEDLFVEDREWDLATWRERYVDHPLTGVLRATADLDASSIRMAAVAATVMPSTDGAFVAADGSAVDAGDGARVRLWHPIDAAEAEVDAWRAALLGTAGPPALQAGVPRGLPS